MKKLFSLILALTLTCAGITASANQITDSEQSVSQAEDVPKVVSRAVIKNPLDGPDMVENTVEIITYSDGYTVKNTYKGWEDTRSRAAVTTSTQQNTAEVFAGTTKIAVFELYASFVYDASKNTVRVNSYSKDYDILSDNHYLYSYDVEKDSGGGGLWWHPWANVKGSYLVALYGSSAFAHGGQLEIKCDSKGDIERFEN